jgi:hypothetical protein
VIAVAEPKRDLPISARSSQTHSSNVRAPRGQAHRHGLASHQERLLARDRPLGKGERAAALRSLGRFLWVGGHALKRGHLLGDARRPVSAGSRNCEGHGPFPVQDRRSTMLHEQEAPVLLEN